LPCLYRANDDTGFGAARRSWKPDVDGQGLEYGGSPGRRGQSRRSRKAMADLKMIDVGPASMDPAPDVASSSGSAPRRLLHVFPGFGVGGVEFRIAAIINRLGRRFSHTIIGLDGVYDARSRLDADADVSFPFTRPWPKENPALAALGARRVLARLGPDLLLTYNWGAVDWALANRFVPVCRHVHFESGFGSPEEAHMRRRILLRRLALGRAERIIVPSLRLARLMTDEWRLPATKIHYIPNGVDLTLFGEAPDPSAIPQLARHPGAFVVGTVTSLRREKNLERMIRVFAAAAEGRDAVLLLVGDGAERPALERYARERGVDRVLFAGFVAAPHRVIGLMDIYAISSDTEQMPNALVQAMAAGRPVVATDVGDIKHIVAEPNRPFVVDPAEESALAACLGRLMDDVAERRRLGAANRARAAERFDIRAMTEAYRAVFDGSPLPPAAAP
ncbi:MAG: glycosyltransferase, partial [Alphaproteobacteria bacterium]